MIDLHCHILHDLDDGPRHIDESLAMCRMAAADGIQIISGTPHMLKDVYRFSADDVLARTAALNAALRAEGIALTVIPGAEVVVDPEILPLIRAGMVLTVNNRGKYVLIELTDFFPQKPVEALVEELVAHGITPIIAHPERNPMIQKNTRLLEGFVKGGALSQVTAMSVTGDFGNRTRKTATTLLKKGLVHLMASDAHTPKWRPPLLSDAVTAAAKVVGETAALKLVKDTPRQIIGDTPYHLPLDTDYQKTVIQYDKAAP